VPSSYHKLPGLVASSLQGFPVSPLDGYEFSLENGDERPLTSGEEVAPPGAPDAETRVLLDEFIGSKSFRLISAYWRFKRRMRLRLEKGA
jgi:hypothetical protein